MAFLSLKQKMASGNGFMAKMVDIPSEMIGQITSLGLAECFSHNEIYINGQLLSAGILRGVRKIIVPANTWQAGMNKLMIKMNKTIEPEWFGLGLEGSSDDLFLSNESQKINIAGNDWKLARFGKLGDVCFMTIRQRSNHGITSIS